MYQASEKFCGSHQRSDRRAGAGNIKAAESTHFTADAVPDRPNQPLR